MKSEVTYLIGEVAGMKSEVAGLKSEVSNLRFEVARLRRRFGLLAWAIAINAVATTAILGVLLRH